MGVIPVKCKAIKDNPRILGIGNAFAGGIFIAIALMHIMPEQVENYEQLKNDENDDDDDSFPVPFLLLVAGYTLILLIDKVIFDSNLAHSDKLEETAVNSSGDQQIDSSKNLARASLVLRKSLAEIRADQVGDKVA